jgi:hypothetical protein
VRRSSAGCKGGAWGATREPDRPTWTPLPGLALFVWFGAMNARRPTATPRIASSSHKAATSCPSVGRVMPSSMPASERMKLSRACCGSKATVKAPPRDQHHKQDDRGASMARFVVTRLVVTFICSA